MINVIMRYKHKVFIKNVLLIIENQQYILKDYFYNDSWCMCLFLNKILIFAIKNKKTGYLEIIKFNMKELNDFNFWLLNNKYEYLKELIKKAHNKKFKKTFLLEKTDHLIEDLSNFLRERNINANLNCLDTMNILNEILKDEFAHLYIENEINNNKNCVGKSFD